jgi:aspartyl protease family protein
MALILALMAVILALMAPLAWAQEIQVKGLFKGSAVLQIDGQQMLLKVGQVSPEGVRLVSADSKSAVVSVRGERFELTLSHRIANAYKEPVAQELRVPQGQGGHYFVSGQVNGRNVDFLVDTGATLIALNKQTAIDLGVNYRAGRLSTVSTANGKVQVFVVNLSNVTVGNLSVNNVQATVHLDDSPSIALLGNSFLGQLNMNTDNGVLVLSSQR